MRILRSVQPLLFAAVLPGLAGALFATEPSWRDATRDVYVDGALDRTTQVFVNGAAHQAAIVCPKRRSARPASSPTGPARRNR